MAPESVKIFKRYPRVCPPPEWPNLILDAKGVDVAYSERAGPLSIKCVFRGEEMHEVGRVQFAVDENSYLILNNGQRYASYSRTQEKVETFTIFFTPGLAEEVLGYLVTSADKLLDSPSAIPLQPVYFFERLYPHDDIVTPEILKIRQAIRSHSTSEVWLEEHFHFLLERLLRVHRSVQVEIDKLSGARRSTRIETYRRVCRAKDFMASNLSRFLGLDQIAEIACLSPHHFLRVFREAFGETPHQYLTRKRLERAQVLLWKSDRSVTDICYEVGFRSLGSFSSLFRNWFGCSPLQFRDKRHRPSAVKKGPTTS